MGIKRLLFVLLLGVMSSVAVVSSAPAGVGLADAPCPDASGPNTNTCPAGTVGVAYAIQFTEAEGSGCGPGKQTFTVDSGVFPPGLSLATSGHVSGTPTEAGSFTFYVKIAEPIGEPNCAGSFGEKRFTIPINPGVPKLTIGPEQTGVPMATVGSPFSMTMSANVPDAKTWSIIEGQLPPGVALGASDGVVSGSPTAEGAFAFRVQASMPDGRKDDKWLTITVRAPLAVAVSEVDPAAVSELPSSEVGARFSAGLVATGGSGTYTWALTGSLPTGVVFDTTTGAIAGRPTVAGTYRFAVTVTDSETRTAAYNGVFTVNPRLAVATTRLKIGRVGRFYQTKLRARGGVAPWQARIKRGPLPRGILFDRTKGVFYGTPTKVGTWRIAVELIDALGVKATATVTLVVRR